MATTSAERDLVDRAVREARTLIDHGDRVRVAVSYVVDQYDLQHRHFDIYERVLEDHP